MQLVSLVLYQLPVHLIKSFSLQSFLVLFNTTSTAKIKYSIGPCRLNTEIGLHVYQIQIKTMDLKANKLD